MNDEIEVWSTKYVLTSGIEKITGKIDKREPRAFIKMGDKFSSMAFVFWVGDWHKTEAEAIARAESMRAKKIASLKKQIAKLEAMKFELKG